MAQSRAWLELSLGLSIDALERRCAGAERGRPPREDGRGLPSVRLALRLKLDPFANETWELAKKRCAELAGEAVAEEHCDRIRGADDRASGTKEGGDSAASGTHPGHLVEPRGGAGAPGCDSALPVTGSTLPPAAAGVRDEQRREVLSDADVTTESGTESGAGAPRPKGRSVVIGQERAVRTLQQAAKAAAIRGRPFKATSGPMLMEPSVLLGLIASLAAETVIFVDEIHALPRRVAEVLYEAMEDGTLSLSVTSGIATGILSAHPAVSAPFSGIVH